MTESGLVNKIRAEEGNERYEYFFPLDDPETVLLIDRWRDQQALDAHHKSEMMEEIAALRKKYALRMRVERYTNFNKRPSFKMKRLCVNWDLSQNLFRRPCKGSCLGVSRD